MTIKTRIIGFVTLCALAFSGTSALAQLSFNGVNAEMDIGGSTISPPWTAELWVNRQDSPVYSSVLLAGGATALKLEQFDFTRQVGITQFGVADYVFNYIAPTNTWVHLAFVGTTNNTQLYANGLLQDTLPESISLNLGQIGSDAHGDRLNGIIDEFRIWNVARSQAQIQANMHQELSPQPGLVAYWQFNEGAGNSANDSSGNGQTGTLDNTGWVVATVPFIPDVVTLGASQIAINGDFETGDFTGWTLSGDTYYVRIAGFLPLNGFNTVIAPFSGNYVAILTTSGSGQFGRLSQTLTTIPGTNYSLSLWLDNPAGIGYATNEFIVSWNGINIFDQDNLGVTTSTGWTNLQFIVAATGTNTVLEFSFYDDYVPLAFDYINVSLLPPNDDFSNSIPLADAGFGNNFGATLEQNQNEPNPGDGSASVTNTVWWSWTAPTNGPASVLTLGSGFDTIIDIYAGNALTNLVFVASNLNTVLNDDLYYQNKTNGIYSPVNAGILNRVGFPARAGTNYQIQISGMREGAIALGVQPIALKVVSVNQVTNADQSVNFNAVVEVGNSGRVTSAPLQLEVLARAGDSYNTLPPDGPPSPSMIPADQVLTNYYSTTIMPGTTTNISISGVCPPPIIEQENPDDYPTNSLGFGWGVFVVLQEQFGTNWYFKDNDLLFYGQWPLIGTVVGPSGGVIRLNPSSQITAANPGFVEIQLEPPAAVQAGAAWQLEGSAGYSSATNHVQTVSSTNAVAVQFKPVPGWNLPDDQTVAVEPGVLIDDIASYTVTNPVMVASLMQGIGITGTTGTVYEIDSRTSLTSGNWAPVRTNTINSNGFNLLLPNPKTNGAATFYRAVWLGR